MPPLPEDDEDVSDDEIPFKDPSPPKEDDAPEEEEEEEEEGGGSEDEEDAEGDEQTFVVERILNHAVVDGALLYEVRWEGYPEKRDWTWEPEENLSTAKETLEAYFKKIGGRPSAKEAKKSRKRKTDDVETPKRGGRGKKARTETPETGGTSGRKSKREKEEREWKPPAGSWETEIMNIDTIEEFKDPKTQIPTRYGYVVWQKGHKTRHALETLNAKAPQKMLRYYESHLVFRTGDETNGENGAMETEE